MKKTVTRATNVPAYQNPALAATARVKDLLARMTFEEKAKAISVMASYNEIDGVPSHASI